MHTRCVRCFKMVEATSLDMIGRCPDCNKVELKGDAGELPPFEQYAYHQIRMLRSMAEAQAENHNRLRRQTGNMPV